MDLSKLTVVQARKDLDARKYSASELTGAYLNAVAEKDATIRAYVEVWEEAARAEARAADEQIARSESSMLTGIPLAVKDNILIEGRTVSAASNILGNYKASYDATAIQKLKGERAIFLGRTNMDEFAMGASTEHSAFGPTKNPRDISRVPGGSSGGSAAAVAADLALAALGSDTGGSIRQPAGFCGVVGLKPTYGAVSRYGLIAMGSSLDQIGPITKTVADSKALFDAIKGKDARDSTSQEFNIPPSGKKVIGVPRKYVTEGVDQDVLVSFEKTLRALESAGYAVWDIELPSLEYSLAMYYIIMPAEASTNLARYDGIRYGLSVQAPEVEEAYARTRGAGFGAEVKRRILIGTFVLSAGYADAYYRKARAARAALRADFARAFKEVGAIAMPTSPTPAFKTGEKSDPLSMYAADIFTVSANLAGVPAISVPAGTVVRGGNFLPVGFQLIAPWGEEETLFAVGGEVERARL